MGWVEELRGNIVGMDTAPLIYFIEENPTYTELVDPFFEAVERSEFSVVTSVVTLLEVLVHPFRTGDDKLAQKYRDLLFNSHGLTTLPLTPEIAEGASRLRSTYHKIRTPDAIQMATAINANASFFLTNDVTLPTLPDLRILQLDELKTR